MRIFLIGFMGTGKSHWGERWAKLNGMQFIDLDALIEKEEGVEVVDIFDRSGEEYFRKKEAKLLRELDAGNDCIISCGGGAPCFYENIHWMNEHGTTVYLSASPQYILGNILEEKEKRPLIRKFNEAEILFFIEQKLKEREPFYTQANFTLNAESLTEDSLTSIIK